VSFYISKYASATQNMSAFGMDTPAEKQKPTNIDFYNGAVE